MHQESQTGSEDNKSSLWVKSRIGTFWQPSNFCLSSKGLKTKYPIPSKQFPQYTQTRCLTTAVDRQTSSPSNHCIWSECCPIIEVGLNLMIGHVYYSPATPTYFILLSDLSIGCYQDVKLISLNMTKSVFQQHYCL